MTDPQALYQTEILEHDENPRNEKKLDQPSHTAKLSNPLCGDRVQVELRVEDGRIAEVGFKGRGCALSRASASMMTESLSGLALEEAGVLKDALQDWLDRGTSLPPELGALQVFAGVRDFPSRKKCVTLAWEALSKALSSGR